MYLTKNELEIMDVLWTAGKPLTRGEIVENSKDKTWKESSFHILINSMIEKGAVRPAGFTKCVKSVGRIYAAAVTVEEYYVSTINQSKTKPSLSKLITTYIEKENISPDELSQIIRYLQDMQSSLKSK